LVPPPLPAALAAGAGAGAGGVDLDLEPGEVVVDTYVTKLLGKSYPAQKLLDAAVKKLVRFLLLVLNIVLWFVLAFSYKIRQ
jgi:hypothetical protein